MYNQLTPSDKNDPTIQELEELRDSGAVSSKNEEHGAII